MIFAAAETSVSHHVGAFDTPSVSELRAMMRAVGDAEAAGSLGGLLFSHVTGTAVVLIVTRAT